MQPTVGTPNGVPTDVTVIFGPPDFNSTTSPTAKVDCIYDPSFQASNFQTFSAQNLRSVAKAADFIDAREPSLQIGDIVRLNSGGPAMMVVNVNAHSTTVAIRDHQCVVFEIELPTPCVHRIRDLI